LYAIDDWVPECNFCKHREEQGMYSPRQQANAIYDNAEPGDGVSLEFQIDRDCNGGCLICGSWNSTTWDQYTKNTTKKVFEIRDNTDNVERWLQQVYRTVTLDKVKRITFLGGEPLRSDTHLRLLKEIEKVRDLSKIQLCYITNGSARPSEAMIEFWKQFRHVNFNLSIDGIGEHFNYLRWPLKWHQVEDNLRYLVDLKIPTFSFTGSYTVTPFSIYYHAEYEAWAKEFFKDTSTDYTLMFGKPYEANGVMNLASLPPIIKMLMVKKYKDYPTPANGHSIMKLIPKYNQESYDKFMDYVNYHDQHRKLNWREVFPEIQQYFK
jgi:pyruvate-formate lyase-activating enzyme